MLTHRTFAAAMLALCWLANLASAQGLPPGVSLVANARYGEHPTGHILDLYWLPNSRRPVPLVIWVHGGEWKKGSKGGWPAISLVDKGFAVASINYRLSGDALFPAQIHDCKAAVRWLRGNARKYKLDPNRFGAWGHSAGGHLVALLGTSGDVAELEGSVGKQLKFSSRVQAVCNWHGPADLAVYTGFQLAVPDLPADYPRQVVEKLLGGTIEAKDALAKQANPITFISKDDPPFLIVYGDRDNWVPLNQGERLERALRVAGVDVELNVVQGKGHRIFDYFDSLRAVEVFFDRTLRKDAGGQKADQAVELLATYVHHYGRNEQRNAAFYSNGRLDSPDGTNTWALSNDGVTLVFCGYRDPENAKPHGVWVYTCVLSPDGRTYTGRTQAGARVRGEIIGQGNLRKKAPAKKRTTKQNGAKTSRSDNKNIVTAIHVNSVWANRANPPWILTVTERRGNTFQGRYKFGVNELEVRGTVEGNKVRWRGVDARNLKGRAGADDHEGTISTGKQGDKIDFVWRNARGPRGAFTVYRKENN